MEDVKASRTFLITVHPVRCKGCELCVAVCPQKVLAMSPSLGPRGVHLAEAVRPQDCTGCLQCSDICPDAAIEIEQEST